MRKPTTVACIITEKTDLQFFMVPDLRFDSYEGVAQQYQQVPRFPGYKARVLEGPLEGHEIFISGRDKSSEPIKLKPGEIVSIQRKPHHLFFYNDYLTKINRERIDVIIEW